MAGFGATEVAGFAATGEAPGSRACRFQGVSCSEGRACGRRMPSQIQVHAFSHVASEPVRPPGQADGAATPAASQPCALGAPYALSAPYALGAPSALGALGQRGGGFCGVKAGRQAAADGGDPPVAVDAGHRAGGQPEAAADHLAALLRVSSPRSTTRPGSGFLGPPRRRLTAWRTP